MIKYKRQLTIDLQDRDDQGDYHSIKIRSDKNDYYQGFLVKGQTAWSKWWEMNHQSELRSWQKDLIRPFATRISGCWPYVVYKPNHGHNQPHDLMVAYSSEENTWLVSTEQDFWYMSSTYASTEFNTNLSLGSVTDRSSRDEIFKLYDALYGIPDRQ